MSVLNAPNTITLLRLLLLIPFLMLLSQGNVLWATGIFILISILDGVDGFVARLTKQYSRLGEIFDGTSDIIILIIAFLAGGYYGYIPEEWHILLVVIPLFLLAAKLFHVFVTGITEHTVAGKINAVLAYVVIIASLTSFPYFSLVIGTFLTTSLYTAVSFALQGLKNKQS